VVTCNGNGCFDENNNYVGNNCDANGCCDQNGICYDVNSLGGSPTQSPSPLDTVSNDDPEWSNLSSEMIYGAIGLSGLAVAAGLLVRRVSLILFFTCLLEPWSVIHLSISLYFLFPSLCLVLTCYRDAKT
jgi:hypothetical protein